MGYFYEEWKNKKITVEDDGGQFIMDFGDIIMILYEGTLITKTQ